MSEVRTLDGDSTGRTAVLLSQSDNTVTPLFLGIITDPDLSPTRTVEEGDQQIMSELEQKSRLTGQDVGRALTPEIVQTAHKKSLILIKTAADLESIQSSNAAASNPPAPTITAKNDQRPMILTQGNFFRNGR